MEKLGQVILSSLKNALQEFSTKVAKRYGIKEKELLEVWNEVVEEGLEVHNHYGWLVVSTFFAEGGGEDSNAGHASPTNQQAEDAAATTFRGEMQSPEPQAPTTCSSRSISMRWREVLRNG